MVAPRIKRDNQEVSRGPGWHSLVAPGTKRSDQEVSRGAKTHRSHL